MTRPLATLEQYRAMLRVVDDPWYRAYIEARIRELEQR